MQQINLYQEQFKKRKTPLSAVTLLTLLILVPAGLAIIHYINYLDFASLQDEQMQVSAEFNELTGKVATAEEAAKPKPVDKLLEKEVEQLVVRLQRNQRLLRALTEGAMSNTRGFSEYFEALANRHVNGTWITRMQIGNGGLSFAFSGKSMIPELVPRYLQNLGDEEIFNNFSFNILEIERKDTDKPVIDFNIATGKG
jgi:MSHA biogenesis protein MshI